MSAYTNGLAFWKHFEEKQDAIIHCLKAGQYKEWKLVVPISLSKAFMILLR